MTMDLGLGANYRSVVTLETETVGGEYTVSRRLIVEDPSDAVIEVVIDRFFAEEE